MSNETGQKHEFCIEGIPVKIYCIVTAIVLGSMALGVLQADMLSTICMLFVLGAFCFFIGDRIPIFNNWIGGGSMMAMLLPSILVYTGVIQEKYVEASTLFFDTSGFQIMFICILMASAFINIDRKSLINSIVRYIPTILGGVAAAALFGCLAGALMGHSISELVVYYVLPIMGGGNGAGAIPMSQIYESVTGNSKDAYYATAVAILTIANILCIIVGAVLNGLGKKVPRLTGDKTSIVRKGSAEKNHMVTLPKPDLQDAAVGLLIIGAVYILSGLMSKKIFPKIGSIQIHQYVYFVLFFVLINVTDIIPLRFRAGIKQIHAFLIGKLSPVAMAACGIVMLDFGEFTKAISLETVAICLAVVLGAVVGTAVIGYLLGFYPIDSAVTAGLCMANRGGSGDVIVLAAADRLELMSYAAISSRLGGGIVLIIAGIVFGALM